MTKNFKVQAEKEHYYEKYDNIRRFVSYFYQIDLTRKLKPKSVLEIGIGNKTVADYLKKNGLKITTCDFDKKLKPDYAYDIRDLKFKDHSFDLILACEILEHLPWEDVEKALKELHRVTKKYVIVSVPYPSSSVEIILKLPLIATIFKKSSFYFYFKMPYLFRDIKFTGEHYWEMGRKSYPISKVRGVLGKGFKVIEEVRPILDSPHYFFVLEKI